MRALIPILVLVALLSIAAVNSMNTKRFDDLNKNNGNICPRDCLCTPPNNSTTARCNRLEVGIQMFGSAISDLIVENLDAKYPMVLTSMIFKNLGLSDLTNIRITNSALTEIDPKAFNGMDSLYSANLTANNIRYLDPYTFENNMEMYLLSLSDNPLLFSRVTDIFLYSTNIQELDISRCNIVTLPLATFSKMNGLMYINLSGNKLKTLDNNLFANLNNLEEIDLSDNLLQTIPSDLFTLNREMATLSIKNNPLTSINGLKISELLSLDLSNGNLQSIGPATFEGMNYLSNLALNGNGIQKIFSLGFAKLTELAYLDLSNNNLDFISNQVIKENINLDVFKIANNTLLKKLPAQGFECNNENFTIHLFDASGCSLEYIADNTFKSMPDLAQLFLSRNKISNIGSSLYHLRHLIELDLSKNLIESLNKNTFSKNVDLRKLNLAGNPLMSISMNLFVNNRLTSLDISSCQLYKLWEHNEGDSKNILNQLSYLNASNNQLEVVDVKDLNMMQSLKTIDISNNPILCDESFKDLTTWLGENKISPTQQDQSISNLAMSPKTNDEHTRWQPLAKEVCGENLEITDYMKNGTYNKFYGDITKVEDDSEDDDDEDDDLEDDEEDDDYYYNSDEESINDISDEKKASAPAEFIPPKKSNKTKASQKPIAITEKVIVESTVDVLAKEKTLDDTDFESDIRQMFDTDVNGFIMPDAEPDPDSVNINEKDEIEKSKLFQDFDDIKNVLDNIDFNRSETVIYTSSFDYPATMMWRIGLITLTVVLLCWLCRLCIMKSKIQRKCTVITVSGNNGRIKTDCGLVYQQLSEDLNCPNTPIIRKPGLVSNLKQNLEETKGLKSPKNIPEAV